MFITINNEDYNYVKRGYHVNSLCYKIKGVGLNFKTNNFKKLNKNIKKILVIAAYKKEKGYFEILKIAEMLKNKKVHIHCYGYGDHLKFKSIKIKKTYPIFLSKFDRNLENKINKYDILLHLSKEKVYLSLSCNVYLKDYL